MVAARLRAAGSVFAEDEAVVLVGAARSPGELERLVSRRLAGEPLEVVVGWVEFCGLRLLVARGVFVPRRRTELLVELALEIVPFEKLQLPPGRGASRRGLSVVVELCCGVGAVATAIARGRPGPGAEVHAADVDPVATTCARANLGDLGQVHTGDLYDALPAAMRGRIDLLLANAPYVPSDEIARMPSEARDHEPRRALDGGPDGLDVQRRIVADAPAWLAPGGHLLIETSGHQAAGTAAACRAAGLTARTVTDADRDATAVVATASVDSNG